MSAVVQRDRKEDRVKFDLGAPEMVEVIVHTTKFMRENGIDAMESYPESEGWQIKSGDPRNNENRTVVHRPSGVHVAHVENKRQERKDQEEGFIAGQMRAQPGDVSVSKETVTGREIVDELSKAEAEADGFEGG